LDYLINTSAIVEGFVVNLTNAQNNWSRNCTV